MTPRDIQGHRRGRRPAIRTRRPALAIALASLLPACGAALDSASGQDATRAGAAPIPFGEPADDRVSARDGDHTDWKTFSLGGPTQVTVEVWWDEPDVSAEVRVRDAFGNVAAEIEHDDDGRHDVLGPVELGDGDWFVEVRARGGDSVYTIVVRAGPGSGGPRPEF